MNPYQFLKEIQGIPTGSASGGLGGGDGFREWVNINPPGDFRTSAGLTLTAATVPAVANLETNGVGVQVIAGQTASGNFVFSVPKDYDPSRDEFSIRILAETSGTTDTPTFTATAYRKRPGTALSSALTVVASGTIPKSTAHAAELTVDLSGNGLLPNDIVSIGLTTSAHATDAVNIYGCGIVYRSNLVFTDMSAR